MRNTLTERQILGQWRVYRMYGVEQRNCIQLVNDQIHCSLDTNKSKLICEPEEKVKTPHKFADESWFHVELAGPTFTRLAKVDHSSNVHNLPDYCTVFRLKYMKLDTLSMFRMNYVILWILSTEGLTNFAGISSHVRNVEVDSNKSIDSLYGLSEDLELLKLQAALNLTSIKYLPSKINLLRIENTPKLKHNILTIFQSEIDRFNIDGMVHNSVRIVRDSYKNKESIYDTAAKLIEAGYEEAATL